MVNANNYDCLCKLSTIAILWSRRVDNAVAAVGCRGIPALECIVQ